MNRLTYDGYSNEAVAADEVTLDNLRELTRRQSAGFELRLLEIRGIAEKMAEKILALTEGGLTALDAIATLSAEDIVPVECYIPHSSLLPENIFRDADYLSTLGRYDRVLFSDILSEILGATALTEADFLPASFTDDSITYVKNVFSDEAFDVFSEELGSPSVYYAKDLRSSVAAVAEGRCGFCLLPLEERGMRIPTVYALILNYDLKINSVIPVFGLDGSADMKYALLSRGFTKTDAAEGDDRYLELRLDGDGGSLGELLLAIEELRMSLYRINTFNVGDTSHLSLVVRDEGRDFTPLLTYLSLFSPDCDFVGLYKNLE